MLPHPTGETRVRGFAWSRSSAQPFASSSGRGPLPHSSTPPGWAPRFLTVLFLQTPCPATAEGASAAPGCSSHGNGDCIMLLNNCTGERRSRRKPRPFRLPDPSLPQPACRAPAAAGRGPTARRRTPSPPSAPLRSAPAAAAALVARPAERRPPPAAAPSQYPPPSSGPGRPRHIPPPGGEPRRCPPARGPRPYLAAAAALRAAGGTGRLCHAAAPRGQGRGRGRARGGGPAPQAAVG